MANPEVSLLIDNGKNKIFERSIIEKFYLMKYPYLVDFLHSPTTDLKSG
ncbi:hypothetical protein RG963_04785 [Methanosarcina sp. Z-7115]|uniref:Uncharacterized protein n=1 Tax=Methanosarcina baikalica TaxID=3073890 RepID=A0ABU2CZE7_9EURY|nr:hypothetical protein [Methanosarcina sp. Z-7115]MDR7665115.1 hypothetical protein [Methanosarcina sp. Z-7115]